MIPKTLYFIICKFQTPITWPQVVYSYYLLLIVLCFKMIYVPSSRQIWSHNNIIITMRLDYDIKILLMVVRVRCPRNCAVEPVVLIVNCAML